MVSSRSRTGRTRDFLIEHCPYGFSSRLKEEGPCVRCAAVRAVERTHLNRCQLGSWVKHAEHLVLYREEKDGKTDEMLQLCKKTKKQLANLSIYLSTSKQKQRKNIFDFSLFLKEKGKKMCFSGEKVEVEFF